MKRYRNRSIGTDIACSIIGGGLFHSSEIRRLNHRSPRPYDNQVAPSRRPKGGTTIGREDSGVLVG